MAWPLALAPRRLERALAVVREARLVPQVPTVWQVCVGVLRMHHRLLFRSDTVGTCRTFPVRATWRARLLSWRPLRFPFLLAERAVAPLDMSGLLSSRERVLRHLLGAHHDGRQFVYDLELLAVHPGALEELRERARAVVQGRDPRAAWLRDLVVFDQYHEQLLATVERVLERGLELTDAEAADPDITLRGYLAWCARRPRTPWDTWQAWRRGELDFTEGSALRPSAGPT